MPSLLDSSLGILVPQYSRPTRGQFQGINNFSPQHDGLVSCFPLWEPPNAPAIDVGPAGLVGTPITTIAGFDPTFGQVFQGGGDTGDATLNHLYRIPHASADAINFGIGPYAFSVSFWFRQTLFTTGAGPGSDFYSFVCNSNAAPYSGYGCSWDTSQQINMFSQNATTAAVFKSPFNPFSDSNWHHVLWTHLPRGTLAQVLSANTYYFDGVLSGRSETCSVVGINLTDFFIGGDDQSDNQYSGMFADIRFYMGELTLADAQSLYYPDTRWELYKQTKRWWFFGSTSIANSGAILRRALTTGDS